MSQQLSIPTGNGLLSLNLSAFPQAAAVPAGGGTQLFTGFSSMMSNITAEGEVPGGAFLPQQGISLPQGMADQMNLDPEQIKQKLLNLAEMLGQQTGSETETAGLTAEVMAELAKALRNFAEGEISELPEELKQKLAAAGAVTEEVLPPAEGVDLSEQQLVADAAEPALEVENVMAELPVEQVTETDRTDEPPVVNVAEIQLPSEEVVADDEAEDLIPLVASTAEGGEESEAGETVASDVQPTNLSDEVVLAGAETAEADAQVQLNTESEAAPTDTGPDEEVVVQVNDTRRSPVAEAARQEFNADLYRNKGEYVSQVARAADKTGNAGAAPTAVASATVGGTINPDASQGGRVAPQVAEIPSQVGAAKNEPLLTATPAQAESIHKSVDNSQLQATAKNFSLDKFESMLEASQKLMTKAVAGAEKLGDSPFAQRLESAVSSTNAVPQSVSQPTQTQKAVAEATNLMMPQNVKLNTAAWSNALAERAVMVAAQNTNVVQIQLDPPELGSLNIRVQINQDQISLNFTSPHAHVRDAVEQSLPRLREMFAEQGLALSDSSVSDQQRDGSGKEEMAGDGRGNEAGYPGQASETEGQGVMAEARNISLVDYYA